MAMIRKVMPAQVTALGENEVEVVISTAQIARDGHVLVPSGARLENYRANPIILWQHDPEVPVGNGEDIQVEGDKIRARAMFAPPGISPKADEIRGLVKAGVIRAVSVGFEPIDGEPLDPTKPRGGQRFTEWDLLEFSFCSVPVDTGAVVTARAVEDAEPTTTDPAEEAAAMTDPKKAPAARRRTRAKTRATQSPTFKRGLYDVAQLAYALQSLGYIQDCAEYEAALEEDNSQVPAMLGAAMAKLGSALVAMTQEEVAELLADVAGVEDDGEDVTLIVEERAFIDAASTARAKAWRRGIVAAKARAGRKISAETARSLRAAMDQHGEAIEQSRSSIALHKEAIRAIEDLLEDTDTTATQTADGTDDSTGSAGRSAAEADLRRSASTEGNRSPSADYRRRQAELLALAAE
jgi:HK97 family phage prohead protease